MQEDGSMVPVKEIEYCASLGNLPKVREALANGFDVNDKEENHCTALHDASENGHLEVVRFLVEHGACINSLTDSG